MTKKKLLIDGHNPWPDEETLLLHRLEDVGVSRLVAELEKGDCDIRCRFQAEPHEEPATQIAEFVEQSEILRSKTRRFRMPLFGPADLHPVDFVRAVGKLNQIVKVLKKHDIYVYYGSELHFVLQKMEIFEELRKEGLPSHYWAPVDKLDIVIKFSSLSETSIEDKKPPYGLTREFHGLTREQAFKAAIERNLKAEVNPNMFEDHFNPSDYNHADEFMEEYRKAYEIHQQSLKNQTIHSINETIH